ncbi:MAG: hypothetical protein P1T08_14335 [Acidimicrobiia bacterium]|nr:hypothetical protein [Acidimicrobiia bacterium]
MMQLLHANSAGFIHGGEIMKLVEYDRRCGVDAALQRSGGHR